ncbi:MAG: hypothetical protein NTZ49_01520 [Candidatus Parcubacteria bacterium]|nr:hypothetical protein [Candidatus Parcubacteria bacterium]
MKPGNFNTYSELTEDIKGKYKKINRKGDFVEKTAVENPEVAHRLALLENEAFGDLGESIKQSNLSVEQIIEKLSQNGLSYDEKDKLKDLLFQHADLARLKGKPIDDQLKDFLGKKYIDLSYSKILTDKLAKGIEAEDIEAMGELLKDEKIHANYELLRKLSDDTQRTELFKICKQRVSIACDIVDEIENMDLAIKMYTKIVKSADKDSYSDENDLKSTGEKIAKKLFKAGDIKRIVNLVKNKTLALGCCKEFLHKLGNEPTILIKLARCSSEPDDILYLLKFVSDVKLLGSLKAEEKIFSSLTDEQRKKVTAYAGNIARALANEPEIVTLDPLKKDETGHYGRKEAKNKFVVGVGEGKYYIAWSNTDYFQYHRDIFEKALPHLTAKSGGYIGLFEEEGKMKIRMTRSSGDYKFYSREVMEHFRKQIEAKLQQAYGDNFELQINISDDYGE